ncbi:guanine nucleotide-binding protein subunit alpha-14-like [Salminus brasiliensis]|uniref:guanine nucleotide-binding protein subunit alpha-14-like n=1 Tax=Salminus brasiliensis TaxID=930266 RepID=UPI003B8305F8
MDGCCMSCNKQERERYRKHREIERQLKLDKLEAHRQVTLLLLGTKESGKSTLVKQMRIFYGKGYSEDDRRGFTRLVFQNIFVAVKAMIAAMGTLHIQFTDGKNTKYAAMISSVEVETVNTMEADYAEAIKSAWRDRGMQECYDRRREFHLLNSAKYFLDDMDRISSAFYLPTDQDILRVRGPTTGIQQYTFELSSVIFRMVDVGGQRSEMRKWIHSFESVTAIIFLVALNEYDQVWLENGNKNRMEESKALFKTIISYPWFQNTSIILYLNKTDLLQEKITKSNLADYFPQYQGPKSDEEAAKQFIFKMYEEQNSERRHLYFHYTCAVDTNMIHYVLTDVKDIILRTCLKKFGEDIF